MAKEFNTIGMKLKYAIEATVGTRPTTGYTNIPGIKSMPDMNGSPNNIQVTDLSDAWHRYIPGVKDVGGTLEFGANLTTDLKTAWETMMEAYKSASADNKSVWFEIEIPNFDSFYFCGVPVELGFGGAEVDSAVETNLYITPNKITGFATASAS